MEKFLRNKIITAISFLVIGILIGWFSNNSNMSLLEQNTLCAKYKSQAEKRISTWYSDKKIGEITLNEMFYSQIEKSCIAVWTSYEQSMGDIFIQNIIFDAITNKEHYSHLYKSGNIDQEKFYLSLIEELKN